MAKKQVDEVALDFSGVKPFEPMDEAQVYLLQATELKLGESKNKNPKVSLVATILGPDEVPVADFDGTKQIGVLDKTTKAKGRKLFREYSFKEEALPFLHEFLKAVDPEIELGEDFVFKPKEYEGLEFAGKIKLREYNGVVQSDLKRALPKSAYKG